MEIFKEKKKAMTLTLIGLMSLILLTVGATYAYFTVNVSNNFGTHNITSEIDDLGTVAILTKESDNLLLDVSASEMLEENVGESYHASGSEEPATIGKIEILGEGVYNCTYTLKVTKSASSSENDLYTKFQNMANKGEEQVYLEINGIRYDFDDATLFNEGAIYYTGTVTGLATGETTEIKANLTIANTNVDQTELNNADVKLTFEATEFNCELLVDEEVPEVSSLSINNGAEYTTEREVEVTFEYEAEDVTKYCVTESENSDDCTWNEITTQTYSVAKSIKAIYGLSSGDGEKKVNVFLMDLARNVSDKISDTIILDELAPDVEVSIASSSESGNGWYSKLTIKGEGKDEGSGVATLKYCTTTSDACTPSTTVEGNTTNVTLSSNAVAQRVCFQAIDKVGRESTLSCSGEYLVDTSTSEIDFSISNSEVGSNGWYNSLTLKITASNLYSGISNMKYCTTTEDTCTPDIEVETNTKEIEFENNKDAQKVCAEATDNKGVTTGVVCSNAYLVDKENPSVEVNTSSSEKTTGGWYTNVSVTGSGSDSASGVSTIKYCTTTNASCTPSTEVKGTQTTITLSSNASTQKVCFQAVDESGKNSEIKCSDGYLVDATETNVAITIDSSTQGNSGWYKALTLKIDGTNEISGISSVTYCTSTSECSPSTKVSGPSTTVTMSNNASAQVLCAYATDNKGTNSETVCSDEYKVDTEVPSGTASIASSTTGSNSWYKALSIKIDGSDEESGPSSLKYCTTTNSTCTPSTSVTGSTKTVALTSNASAQKICYQVTDVAGNTSSVACTSAYKVDTSTTTTAIAVSSSTAGSNSWYKALTLSITGTNSYSGVSSVKYCTTTSSSCTPGTSVTGSSTTVTLSSNASAQVVCANATDNKGDTSATVCSSAYKVDTTNPSQSFSIASSTAGTSPWYKALSIKITGSDSHSKVASIKYCTTTGSTCTPSTSVSATTATVTLSSNASAQKICAQVTDTAGRTSTTSCSSAYSVDTTKPTISSVTASETTTSSITVKVTASDSHSKVKTYYYQLGSNSVVSNTTGTYTFSGLTAGTSYSIKVYVIDNAGQTSTTTTKSFNTSSTAAIEIQKLSTAGLNTTLEGGLYRYQGASGSVNNYICFGTSTKSTCTGNTDQYMYRIIGINESGQLKLIKKEALNDTMQWYSDYTTNITWPQSTIYSNINGSSFYTNTTYVPTAWQSKIAESSWKYGDNTSVTVTASSLYTTENAWTTTTSAKIGLMYTHDYAYAYQSGGLNCSSSGSYGTCKTSWLFLGNCDSGAPSVYEWTMSRYGYQSSTRYYRAWSIDSNGYSNYPILGNEYSVRPVFYLTSDVQFVSGTGTSSDPFIIK